MEQQFVGLYRKWTYRPAIRRTAGDSGRNLGLGLDTIASCLQVRPERRGSRESARAARRRTSIEEVQSECKIQLEANSTEKFDGFEVVVDRSTEGAQHCFVDALL